MKQKGIIELRTVRKEDNISASLGLFQKKVPLLFPSWAKKEFESLGEMKGILVFFLFFTQH